MTRSTTCRRRGSTPAAGLVRDTLAAARPRRCTPTPSGLARDVLVERLLLDLDRFDSGDLHASLNVIASPVQDVRHGLRPDADRRPTTRSPILARRMAAVPDRARRLPGEPAGRGGAAGGWSAVAAGRQVRRPVRHLLRASTRHPGSSPGSPAGQRRRQAGRSVTDAGRPAPRPPTPRTPSSASFLRSELRAACPGEGRRRPGAVRRWPPATSSAPPSISRRPTPGAGTEFLAIEAELQRGGRADRARRHAAPGAADRAGRRSRATRSPALDGLQALDAGPVRPGGRRPRPHAFRHPRRRCARWNA